MFPASELIVNAEIARKREEAQRQFTTSQVIRASRLSRRRRRRLGLRLPQARPTSTAR